MIALTTVIGESAIAEALIAKWATVEDHAQTGLQQSDKRRRNFLLARASLRALLACVTGNADWQIIPDAKGKPQALAVTGMVGPHISLSHTQGLIACVVSEEAPIGIDIEYWRHRDFTALAGYAFGPRECEEVARDGTPAFYRIWTLREAISKATGVGMLATIDGRDRVADAPASGCWATEAWQLFYNSPQTGYSLALASECKNIWSEASLSWIECTA